MSLPSIWVTVHILSEKLIGSIQIRMLFPWAQSQVPRSKLWDIAVYYMYTISVNLYKVPGHTKYAENSNIILGIRTLNKFKI